MRFFSVKLIAAAVLLAAGSASAADDFVTRVVTKVRGTVIALHGNGLTITDSEYRNAERELVIGAAATITMLTDDGGTTTGDLPNITPGQTVQLGVAIDGVTVGTVAVQGEYVSGVIKEIDEGKITIGFGSGASAKTRNIAFFGKTEIRFPAEADGKKTTRAGEKKELEVGQSVSVRTSMTDNTKARIISVTRLSKRQEAIIAAAAAAKAATQPSTQPTTLPSATQASQGTH